MVSIKISKRIFFILLLLLVLGITPVKTKSQSDGILLPKWEYIASEIDYIRPDGGFSQWSDLTSIDITLEDLSGSGKTLVIQAYFCYNDTKLYVGLLVPKETGDVSGLELIFLDDSDVVDGIIVDTDLQEGRDVVYVNHTYVAFDSDLGGREAINVQISDEGDDEFYMITDDIRYPDEDLDGYWNFDDGDSYAVIFQAWVDKPKDDVNRPNFSTATTEFNYLKLSIKEDHGWLPVPEIPWDLMWDEDLGLPEVSWYEREEDVTLDGKKDEEYWTQASTSNIDLFLVSRDNSSSILHSTDPAKFNVSISFFADKSNLYMFLEIVHGSDDDQLEQLSIVLGNEANCLVNLSAPLIQIVINPTNGSYLRSGTNAQLRIPGIVPTFSPDYYGIVSTVNTYGIKGLEYGTFRTFGPHGVESVEVKIPIFGSTVEGIPALIPPEEVKPCYIIECALWPLPPDSSTPNDDFYSAITLEEDQLHFKIYKIKLTSESSIPTRTNLVFSANVFAFLPLVWVLTLLQRKKKQQRVKN